MNEWRSLLSELETVNEMLVSPIFHGSIDTRDLRNTSQRLDGLTVVYARLRPLQSSLSLEHSRWRSTIAKGLAASTEAEIALLLLSRAWRRLYLLQSRTGDSGTENERNDLDSIC